MKSLRRIAIGSLCLAGLATPDRAQTIGNFPDVAVPSGNPLTPQKALLGKALFFEEQLSSDNTMACATCHLPEAGGSEARAGRRAPGLDGVFSTADDEVGSSGVIRQDRHGAYRRHRHFGVEHQGTDRHAPTVYGAAFFESLFWDASAGPVFRDSNGNVILTEFAALENQAVIPPVSPVEMSREQRTWDEITAKLAASRPLDLAHELPSALAEFVLPAATYGELFELAFGTPQVTRERVAMALASYLRTLVPDHTPFDLGTMTPRQELGLLVFRREACDSCHVVENGLFSDGLRHTIGLPSHPRSSKTPTLRNVGLQRRLASSGQLADLDAAVDHYQDVALLGPLTPDERAALIDFMANALTDERVLRQEPPFDRPRLHSERSPPGARLFGEGWPGTGGAVPLLIAETPSSLGNGDFKVGVGNGLPGAPVFLVAGPRRSAPGSTFRRAPLHVDLAAHDVRIAVLGDTHLLRGLTTFRWPIPADAALVGETRVFQAFVLDPGALGGVSATCGAEWRVFSTRSGPPAVQAR